MQYYNTIYPFGLYTELFNKPVKSYFTLCIENSNFKHYYDNNTIYSHFNHNMYTKATRTKRGNSSNRIKISKNKFLKDIKLLNEQFILTYDWTLIRKYIFAIRKKRSCHYTY